MASRSKTAVTRRRGAKAAPAKPMVSRVERNGPVLLACGACTAESMPGRTCPHGFSGPWVPPPVTTVEDRARLKEVARWAEASAPAAIGHAPEAAKLAGHFVAGALSRLALKPRSACPLGRWTSNGPAEAWEAGWDLVERKASAVQQAQGEERKR